MHKEEKELLLEYLQSLNNLENEHRSGETNDLEFEKIYLKSLASLQEKKICVHKKKRRKIFIVILSIVLSCCTIYLLVNNLRSFHSGLQEFIHPLLQLLRKLSIPFISLFPSLTDYYHETCLLQNPFFSIVDMDCWPCSTVNNIREVVESDHNHVENNTPFIYETQQQKITIQSLKDLYEKHRDIFEKESPNIVSQNVKELRPEKMFRIIEEYQAKDNFIWKFNTMNVARILRQLIARPKAVPKYGQSTERFLIINTDKKYFKLPDTECSYSFLIALSGNRFVELNPAEECKQQCKTLKVELKESYLLWYNWWFWKPALQSTNKNETFIMQLGSYC